jgi:tetratricopeptide (TPR) repeat protein
MRIALALVAVISLLSVSSQASSGYDRYNVGGYWADKRGDKEKAVLLWKQAVEFNERGGKVNVAVALNCDNVAGVLRDLKRWPEAIEYSKKACQSWKTIGKNHKAGISAFDVGQALYNSAQYAEAEKWFNDSLTLFDPKEGKYLVASAMNWKAYSQFNEGHYQPTLDTLDELAAQRSLLKKNDDGTVASEALLKGECYVRLNRLKPGLDQMKTALTILTAAKPRLEARITEANEWIDYADKQLAAQTQVQTVAAAGAALTSKPVTTTAPPVVAPPVAPTRVEEPPPTVAAQPTSTTDAVNRPIKDKWALVIGISKFQHPEYNLKYAAKDAQDFKTFLIRECNFSEDHVRLLTDSQATRQNIMSAFGDTWLPRVAMPDDLVVIYVSTHGTPATRDPGKKNYIVAWDTDRDQLFGSGVNMNDLCSQIRERVNTDRVLIVMDTCYSGAAASDARGLERTADNFDAEVIAQGAGRLVISSSSPNEQSWESRAYQNGIFTHNLIECLRKNNHQIDILSAFAKMKKDVQWEVQSNYGVTQTPTLGGKWEGIVLQLAVPPSEHRSLPASLRH